MYETYQIIPYNFIYKREKLNTNIIYYIVLYSLQYNKIHFFNKYIFIKYKIIILVDHYCIDLFTIFIQLIKTRIVS